MSVVLIVDDRAVNRELVCTLLTYGGHQVIEAREGAEALVLAHAQHPDLVLTDILMPGMDGYQLARELRAAPDTAATPIVFYTANYQEAEIRPFAEACGVARVLLKSADPQVLMQTVDELLAEGPVAPAPIDTAKTDYEHLRAVSAKLFDKTESLRDTETRFRLMADSSPVGIAFGDQHGSATYINPRLIDIMGAPDETLLGLGWLSCADDEHRDDIHGVARGVGPRDIQHRCRTQIGPPDEPPRWLNAHVQAIRDDDGKHTGFIATIDDVTSIVNADQQRLAAERQHDIDARDHATERLDSLSTLAGGVAHDFNNILGSILAFEDFISESITVLVADGTLDADTGRALLADLTQIRKGGQRATGLTQQLLTFGSRKIIDLAALDLNQAIRESNDMLAPPIGAHITIVTHLDPELRSVLAEPTIVAQILHNLTINASQAMPEGGTITISTANVAGADVPSAVGAQPIGTYARLTVRDSGHGMTPETLQRAIEPFFTTKGRGLGTGLGLATVYGIVNQLGGALHITSAVGDGAAVTIHLPTTDQPVDTAVACAAPAGGAETILIAEDEDGSRDTLTHTFVQEPSAEQDAFMPVGDFRTVFESAPSLCLVLDPQFRILGASESHLRATMTVRAEIMGRDVFDVFPDNPDDPDATGVVNLRASLNRVRQCEVADTMAIQKYEIGSPAEPGGFESRYWSVCNSPVFGADRKLIYILNEVQDVTEFIRLQQQGRNPDELTAGLRDRTQRMQVEILRSSGELQSANQALRAANEAKNEFLSRVSHELRTPLTAILGFSQLLSLDELSPEHRDWVTTVLKAGRHLLTLLDDILDISHIEDGHLSISVEPIPVAAVITDALNLSRPLADAGGVTLVAPAGPPTNLCVAADHKRLRQVLLNLLSNAIKYNHPAGSVTVTVGHSADHRLRISVTDTGRGIPANALGKLFTPFERLDAARSGITGTGLSLALSRQLMHAMHGTLDVSSLPGQGSTFWLDLPTTEPDTTTRPPAQADDLAPHHRDPSDSASDGTDEEKRVLYVEDVEENMQLVERVLTRRPAVTLIPAMFGATAQGLARDHHPHLIMLDLHLPDITGEEVMRRLQADPTTCDIPILVLSADATRDHIDRLLATGANAYLTKPFAFGELLHTIDDLLHDRTSTQPTANRPLPPASG
jgi:PAS domain S-box-containing protein